MKFLIIALFEVHLPLQLYLRLLRTLYVNILADLSQYTPPILILLTYERRQ